MYELFFKTLNGKVAFTQEEQAIIKTYLTPKKIRKKQYFLQEGDVCKMIAFVEKGALRAYSIGEKGAEHIIQFAPENWWISDKGGATEKGPAYFFIDAIEDSDVLLLNRQGHMTMMEKVPAYSSSFQVGIQKRNAAKDKRIVHSLASPAETRYNDFLDTYPSIAQRIPQHMLASYLGITPETLSRIRRRAMQKK